jgi:hypothetical protein
MHLLLVSVSGGSYITCRTVGVVCRLTLVQGLSVSFQSVPAGMRGCVGLSHILKWHPAPDPDLDFCATIWHFSGAIPSLACTVSSCHTKS